MSKMKRRYFHIGYRVILLDRLNHDLDTAESEPDCHDETWLVYMCRIESYHEDPSCGYEDRLTYTRVDGRDMDVTSVVYFFEKK
jgi:hypothetical protein